MNHSLKFFTALVWAVTVFGADAPPAKIPSLESPTSRVVDYHNDDIVPVKAALRFQIVVVLPEKENVLSATSGDVETWKVDWRGNFVFIKPARAGIKTNISVICESGNLYSFIAKEESSSSPDLKIFVRLADAAAVAATTQPPRFITREEAEALKKRAELAEQQALLQKAASDKQIAAERAVAADSAAASIMHDYRYDEKHAHAMGVASIYHDPDFTWVELSGKPGEVPAFYAHRDGKDQLVQSEYDKTHTRYKITGVVDQGYLRIGKTRFKFQRKSS